MRRFRVSTPSTDGRTVTTYVHMTALAIREARPERRRFGRSDRRTTHAEHIMRRVERGEYTVDPHKVAEAILRRLLAGEGQCS
jgi:anti-sigma28 factor (negative regulator of flagellin synthesis)